MAAVVGCYARPPMLSRAWPGPCLVLALVAGCGGGRYYLAAGTPAEAKAAGAATAPAAPAGEPAAEAPPLDVRAAGLPFAIVDGRSGRAVDTEAFWQRLRAARAVCAGELHPSPHDHWAQLQILDALSTRPGPAGLALGLEMVQRPFQGVLEDWREARIDEAALLSRIGWGDRWGFDFALYRPLFELVRERKLGMVALNAPGELVKRVSKVGVDGLDPTERARLPALVLDDAQHRAWFARVMEEMSAEHGGHGGHGHGGGDGKGPSAANIYAAQVVWDESMAEGAAAWLADAAHRIVIVAGNGHCHDSAIVRRLGRRGVTGVLSVRPIVDDGQGAVADALAEGENDFLFVMTPKP